MSRINRLKLSLVASTLTRVPPRANQEDAMSTAMMPEGWFCDEVGYVGETTADARVLTLARPPRLD
ncbi:hypothetical protein [Paraburkholderia sp. GAS348]|uniref:hypothetical protein n=1 Tax=Paraburkholderia sp. GAS348 TaxID=3035132 RepID=UPI003D1B002B